MHELTTVKFNGSELAVIERDGKRYVAMKPIVEAMGLDWDSQKRNIANDPVLNSVKVVMTSTGADGKKYDMVCLPLDYLNGWLFKIPASRYEWKRRETIIRYQKECYQALNDYFHKGVAINRNLPNQEILLATLYSEMEARVKAESERDQYRANIERLALASKLNFGEVSESTGLPKDIIVACHCKSSSRPHRPQYNRFVQLVLPMRDIVEECKKRLNIKVIEVE